MEGAGGWKGDLLHPSGRWGGRQCPTRPRGVEKGPEPALAEEEQWGWGGQVREPRCGGRGTGTSMGEGQQLAAKGR